MRKKLKLLPVVLLSVSLLSSCGKNAGVTLAEITAEDENGQQASAQDTEAAQQASDPSQQSATGTAQQSQTDSQPGLAQVQQPGQSGQQPDTLQESAPATLYVYVCGAVINPGVYELPPDSRICDALEAAGGFTEEADINRINLAGPLADGMMIFFPETGEEIPEGYEITAGTATGQTTVGEKTDTGLVNINTAGIDLLCTLPGIGESKAKAIVEYREEHGPFAAKEDITSVSGIGAGLYKNIEDLICV